MRCFMKKLLDIMKNHKKSLVIISIVVIITAICLISPSRDEKLKRYASERLSNHYGEEFEILHIFDKGNFFYVQAAPIRDKDIVFTAKFTYGGGEDSEYDYDEYIEACTAHTIMNEIYPDIKDIYGEIFISPSLIGEALPALRGEDVTMDYIKRYAHDPSVVFYVAINKSACKNIAEEYEMLSNVLASFDESTGVDVTIVLYFLGTEEYESLSQYGYQLADVGSVIDLNIKGEGGECTEIDALGINNGELNITKDEYYKKRGHLQ